MQPGTKHVQLNQQAPMKPTSRDTTLLVHSIFLTIQGEGPFVGRPAVFVRLYGCNLQCPQCDTDYTSTAEVMRPEELVERIAEMRTECYFPSSLVVITGGEPFRQPLAGLVHLLHSSGFTIQIETNGTIYEEDFPYALATIVCSPKTGRVAQRLQPYIDCYKYVLDAAHVGPDGLPTSVLGLSGIARPSVDTSPSAVYVQPADTKNEAEMEANVRACVQSCLLFGYTMCVQVHKLIGVE